MPPAVEAWSLNTWTSREIQPGEDLIMREGWIPAWALTGPGFRLVHLLLTSLFSLSGGLLGFCCSTLLGVGRGVKVKGLLERPCVPFRSK